MINILEFIKEYSVVVIIFATAINVYFVYKNYSFNKDKRDKEKPVIDIKLRNTPFYSEGNDKTTITLKNVGTADTTENVIVLVSCSWLPGVSYKLNFPSEADYLAINEEYSWKLHLSGTPAEGSTIVVKVVDQSSVSWELHEQV